MIRIDIVNFITFSGASIGCTTVYPGFNISIIAFSVVYKSYIHPVWFLRDAMLRVNIRA